MDGPRATGVAIALALLLALSPVAALPTTDASTGTAGAPSDAPPARTGTPTADAGPPASAAATSPPVTERNGTTAYLSLPSSDVTTSTVAVVRLDVGATMAMDDATLRGRYARLRLVEAFEAAETAAERRATIARSHERLDERIATLERRERQALARYNRGSIGPQTYLRELAAVDAGADALAPAVQQLYQYTQSVDDSSVDAAAVAELKARLVGLQGPVREQAKRAMRGDEDTERVFVSTSASGVVLSTIVGEEFDRQFVREAYLPDQRAAGAPDQFFRDDQYQLEAAQDRARALYPWAFDNQLAFSVGSRTGAPFLYLAGVYSVTVDHRQGTARNGDLITYIDGGTADVFREVQYLSVDEVPTSGPRVNTSDGLLLQVNRTYAGGPLEIQVRDNESNDPVAATVTLDGERVGRTGPDGRLWTVTPRDPFVVNATARDTTVSVPITFPSDPFASQS
ncbi:hypothetical protein N0B31_12200 [Salinirubellus salinus]|uniref:Uncharacterized protein n=1 Tax=Salinirubellus salinus TaxID=1364945 RepID=A0A9E7QZI0_9EURY|nr:hypothetical protein [Salinirubellus salinus]UWM52910.1 hypothetical protein N0B31_12200 [Salinirubellus salinus]